MSRVYKLCHRRIRAFVKAAGYQQFVIDRRRLMPTACDCVVGGAGYMNEDDLAAFDAMADMHCNGRVYEVEETAEEAVKAFVLLRHERATAIRAIMIHKLVRTLDACRVNNWVDSGNFSSFVSRRLHYIPSVHERRLVAQLPPNADVCASIPTSCCRILHRLVVAAVVAW